MEWKQIQGYEGYYVSDRGDVKSYNSDHAGHILKPNKSDKGYIRVSLRNSKGGSSTMNVHRLVASAFIPNPDNLPQVNHKNGIKDDNRVENLEWVTSSQNVKHAYEVLGKQSGAQGKHFERKAKLLPIEVKIVRQTDIPNIELAKYLGVTDSCICHIRQRRTYKYID